MAAASPPRNALQRLSERQTEVAEERRALAAEKRAREEAARREAAARRAAAPAHGFGGDLLMHAVRSPPLLACSQPGPGWVEGQHSRLIACSAGMVWLLVKWPCKWPCKAHARPQAKSSRGPQPGATLASGPPCRFWSNCCKSPFSDTPHPAAPPSSSASSASHDSSQQLSSSSRGRSSRRRLRRACSRAAGRPLSASRRAG